jgi:hypothetical protein
MQKIRAALNLRSHSPTIKTSGGSKRAVTRKSFNLIIGYVLKFFSRTKVFQLASDGLYK